MNLACIELSFYMQSVKLYLGVTDLYFVLMSYTDGLHLVCADILL